MVKLRDICYVRLGTRDLGAADRFVRDVVGLDLCRRESNAFFYRSDDRDHTLVYFEGDPGDQTVGFEVATVDDLASARVMLSRRAIACTEGTLVECEQRRVQALVRFRDPTGNHIELVVGPARDATQDTAAEKVGFTGFSHIGLCTKDPKRDERFWTRVLGARVSDWIGDAALLRIDDVHHKVALFPARRAGVQHINHQVESIDEDMRAWYALQRQGIPILFGPGRHPTSGAIFLYFAGPDGMVFEYSTGVRRIPDESAHTPRRFPACDASFCTWGAISGIGEFRCPS